MIGNNTVDFFRHATVETSQSRFYVGHADRQLRRSQRASERRVRIAVDQKVVWSFGEQDIFDAFEHGASLSSRANLSRHLG